MKFALIWIGALLLTVGETSTAGMFMAWGVAWWWMDEQ